MTPVLSQKANKRKCTISFYETRRHKIKYPNHAPRLPSRQKTAHAHVSSEIATCEPLKKQTRKISGKCHHFDLNGRISLNLKRVLLLEARFSTTWCSGKKDYLGKGERLWGKIKPKSQLLKNPSPTPCRNWGNLLQMRVVATRNRDGTRFAGSNLGWTEIYMFTWMRWEVWDKSVELLKMGKSSGWKHGRAKFPPRSNHGNVENLSCEIQHALKRINRTRFWKK